MPEKFTRDKELTPALIEAVMHPFKIPESPSQAPESIDLARAVTGDIINALLRQATAKNKIEESQYVGMQREHVIFTNSPVFKGSPSLTADALEEIRRWLRKNPTVATYWHTHISEKTPYFTPDDIARAINFSEKAVITLLGSSHYIWGLVRTNAFEPTVRNPIRKFNRDFELYKQIAEIYQSDERPPDLQALANFLETKGFALYVWFNLDNLSVVEAARNGEFKEFIRLKLIKASEESISIFEKLRQHIQDILLGKSKPN